MRDSIRVTARFFALCTVLFLGTLAAAPNAEAAGSVSAEVEMFTPQGSVKAVRQVRAKFSTAMIAFGDPRAIQSPFDIKCPEAYTTRWADTRNWVLDFKRDVPPGVSCSFSLKNALKDHAGQEVMGQRDFKFSTGGPAIVEITPQTYQDIESEQAFILELDGRVDEGSLETHAYFSSPAIPESVPLRVIRGQDRTDILKSHYRYRRSSPEKLSNLVIVQPVRAFPDGAEVTFHWPKGILSADGLPVTESQTYTFKVRPPFSAQFTCIRDNQDAACNPILPMTVAFTAPIDLEQAARIRLSLPDGSVWTPEELKKKEDPEREPSLSSVSFKGPFPENREFTVQIPRDVRDENGRALANASQFPLAVRTDSYSPLAKFAATFGILELKADPILPLSLRNVEGEVAAEALTLAGRSLSIAKIEDAAEVIRWLNRLHLKADDWDKRSTPLLSSSLAPAGQTQTFQIKKPAGPRDFELVGIPLPKPGLHIVEVASPLLGRALLGGTNKTMYVASGALVTNLSVHLKWGRENSLVWVTELATGRPVADARVSVRGCDGHEYATGSTDASGTVTFTTLPVRNHAASCKESVYSSGLFAFAQKQEDFSFVYSGWNEGIEPWRFSISDFQYDASTWGGAVAHTVFDRMLYRAGEPVHMKHVLRDHRMQGFAPVPEAKQPKKIVVRHMGSGQTQEFPLKWSASGTAETTWTLPKEAKLGTYRVSFSQSPIRAKKKSVDQTPSEEESDPYGYGDWSNLSGGNFRVEEFRVPLMRAVLKLPPQPQVRPQNITADISVQYLAGGGARGLPVRLRTQVTDDAGLGLPGYEDFAFSSGEVKEKRGSSERADSDEEKQPPLISKDLKLDDTGSLRAELGPLPSIDKPKALTAEMEFTDPNGEIQAVSARVKLLPSRHLVGLKTNGWMITDHKLDLKTIVVDPSGHPVANAEVEIEAFRRLFYSHRKKLIGGFYAYENTEEIKRVGSICRGRTDDKGFFACEQKAPASGSLILQAKTKDPEGFSDFASQSVNVLSPEEMQWAPQGESDRVDLLTEKRRYEPGEHARLQLKVPFQESTVLVTVEREGILDRFVQTISREKPFIDLPIKGNYAPNVYVSALAVRGRIGEPKPTALLDLGRPAYKMGLSEIKVGWGAHELKVSVKPDQSVYKVRDKARVHIQVTRADGGKLAPGSEIALAAVDEGLLQLQPNTSWDLLAAMMGNRSLEVATSTAQSFVIGKRHFGLKARPPGGDGGARTSRELFDTLLLWKGKVALDAKGEADVEIPLNDSITAFAIEAIAQSGWNHFGSGQARIQSTKDLMIFSGIAPLVRESDRIDSSFTIRNATDHPMQVKATVEVSGVPETRADSTMALVAGESKIIRVPVQVPVGRKELEYTVRAQDLTSGAMDSLKAKSQIAPLVPERVLQSTIAQLTQPLKMPIELPSGALKGRGGINVIAQSKLGRGLDGVKRYMRAYPFTCMEQMLSRAISLEDASLERKVLALMPSYLDADGLLKFFPGGYLGSDVLTSYALSISDEAGLKIPEDTAEKMREALKRFVQGQLARETLRTGSSGEFAARKLAALEAISRTEPITPDLISTIEITPNVWPTSAVLDWWMILRRSPQLPNQAGALKVAQQILRARLNFQGSMMGFSTEKQDRLSWLMTSIDANSVRLLLAAIEDPSWREDIPRLVRGSLLRQRHGHWDLTTANAWGTVALKKFSNRLETQPVTGEVRARLGSQAQSMTWKQNPDGKILHFAWPQAQNSTPIQVEQAGQGQPWVTLQAIAALPLKAPLSSGYQITRRVEPVEQKVKGRWSVGDVARVRLEVDAQTDQSWVVVSDPVPAGATILGSGLGGDSALLNKPSGEAETWASYQERSFEAFRSYHPYVSKGKMAIEYTLRFNSPGRLNLPPTRVEAMYAPEMFAEVPNASFDVAP